MMIKINEKFKRVDKSLIEEFKKLGVATLGHFADDTMLKGIRPVFTPVKCVGPALTVEIYDVDSAAVHLAIDYIQPGDVLVISVLGNKKRSCLGGLVSYAAKRKGAIGAIVDGTVCDIEEIIDLKFPVFSRGVSPLTTRILGFGGKVGYPIAISGVVINPGDLVFADSDGVAILDEEKAKYYLNIVKESEENEKILKEKINKGASLAELSGASKFKEEVRL